jgi:GAF domain-containing protein/anti-sigma regulatory factor (Ser/Thr protein kinase)/anti-anti-sigma regulatory factor
MPDHASPLRAHELAGETERALEAEQRARRWMEALQSVTSALSGAATPEQVGAAIAEHGARALGSTGGVVFALAPDRETLGVIGTWGYSRDFHDRFSPVPVSSNLPVSEAARERCTVSVGPGDALARRYPDLAAAFGGHASLCAVPLLAGEAVLGAVAVSRSAIRGFDGPELELLEALGHQGGLALERARLYDRLHRLQTTTAALARALTPQEVAATAAAQGAEALGASSAWVALLAKNGRSLELAHAAGHEPATQRRFASLPLDAELPLAVAARTAEPVWLESAEAIFGGYPRFREVRPQAQAAALLPLSDEGAALGAIGLVFDYPHVFAPADRDYLLALTRLCGQALGRARRYQVEHDVAASLQHALLPDSLPQADGLELAVRYLPAADGTAAGGDFYEAVELPGGRLGLAVGDIVGHGPDAAAAMGQLRSAVRAYALEGRSPARVVQLLSRYADGVPGARGATLVYAVLDPGARELRYACAGHPPPLLVGPDGDTRFLQGARGVPLDRTLGHVYEDATAQVPEHATLVLYTDGAIERRGEPLDIGLARLAQAASAGARLDPEAFCTELLDALFAGGQARRDDVALLAARALPLVVAPLQLWFAARADQLSVVREAMRTWLQGVGVEAGDSELVVLAAGELCANAVEHAYPPDSDSAVEVALAREPGGVLTLAVRDHGRWRPPPVDPGDRGRGLSIVRALMHAVDIDAGADGTTVSARFRPGGAPPATFVAPPPRRGGLVTASLAATVELTSAGDVPVARLRGEIDSFNAADVGSELAALVPGPSIVDLSELAFLGSAGLRELFALARRCERLAVVAPPGATARRVLEVAQLVRVSHLADSVHAALEHLGTR